MFPAFMFLKMYHAWKETFARSTDIPIDDRWLQILNSSQTCTEQVQLNNICRKIHNVEQIHIQISMSSRYMQHVPDRSSIVFCLDGRCVRRRQDMNLKWGEMSLVKERSALPLGLLTMKLPPQTSYTGRIQILWSVQRQIFSTGSSNTKKKVLMFDSTSLVAPWSFSFNGNNLSDVSWTFMYHCASKPMFATLCSECQSVHSDANCLPNQTKLITTKCSSPFTCLIQITLE